MHSLLNFFVLLWMCSKIKLTVGNYGFPSIYNNLQQMNEICDEDNCSSDYKDLKCHCDATCVQSGTCCTNSYYIGMARPAVRSTCRHVYNSNSWLYMIDRCPTSDSVWESLCRAEWNSEDDIIRIVPVTSLSTYITYKNYFCFRCHEDSDGFFFWKVKFDALSYSIQEEISDEEKQQFSLNYDFRSGSWIVSFRNTQVQMPVIVSFQIPQEISSLVKTCNPFIISNCSDQWTNSEVREKCQAYMSIRGVQRDRNSSLRRYKNLHCALCNFEDLNDVKCLRAFPPEYPARPFAFDVSIASGKKPFSFSYLLDVNPSGGDRVGKIRACEDDHVWDPYFNFCRKLTCAIPGYKIRNGKCQRG